MDEQRTYVPVETEQRVSKIMHKEDALPAHKVRSVTPLDHLISFPGTHWGVWRWFALRGAGFPASQVLQLATPAYAEATDRFLMYEAESEQAQQIQQARAELQEQYTRATVQSMQVLSEVARTAHFREAVLWQNRGAVRNAITPFLNKPIIPNPARSQRIHGQLIAKYLQRYCTKNDTIGFFGPVGWGCWVSTGAALTVRPGPRLLATRTVYFETWGIDVLGEVLAQDSALLPWAIPRPMPFLSLSGTTLHVPFVQPLQLSSAQASVLAACDGQRTAREVAQAILQPSRSELAHEAEVFAILDELRAARRISWTFEVSMEDWHPERALRRQLERIMPASLRQKALDTLDRLDIARVAVAAAAGNEEQLNQALEHLEATFAYITGQAANRGAGKTYAARTLVYEDCRRDLELTLGSALLAELVSPLSLLLASTRWFTYTIARFYRKAFRKKYIELVQKSGSSTVDFATYWSWVQPLFPAVPGQLLIDTLLPEFQKRWAAILNIPAGQSRVHYTSQELQPRMQEIFRAPHAGWPSACYASPDVLIAATSTEAILRGDYALVLGEFHQGTNTLDFIALVAQHPVPSDLMQAVAADHPEPRVVPVLPRHTIPVKRAHAALTLPKDWRLIFSADSAGVPPERALPLGSLILEECEGELVVRTRDD
ncbi:MAG: lantibiotic dehydratase, partial [Ktedonobacteraceae bacterium]|nr:lantibiotic dehydratase [Ktedonobacteraceae bacterium]